MDFVGKMSAKARKKSDEMTEKARKMSDEMTEKAMEKSKEIERDFEKPIAALKSSLVTQKLVKIMKDQGEHAAAEFMKEVMSLP